MHSDGCDYRSKATDRELALRCCLLGQALTGDLILQSCLAPVSCKPDRSLLLPFEVGIRFLPVGPSHLTDGILQGPGLSGHLTT